jgi:tRNA (guanine26-N2/guanine27-N2)-dimethyltransferase
MVIITEIAFPTEKVNEGKVEVIIPKLDAFITKTSDYAPSKAPVFYNPIMELNRDIAILTFKSYQKLMKREISFCEPLTSSGIRGVRIAIEVPYINKIIINDINPRAVQLATLNVKLNDLEDRITIENKDANLLLSQHGAPRKRFDIVDIDPFGSPVPYLDTAVRALRNNGLLALTATDLAPLCGVHSKACRRKYGGKPLRTEYCHENAVRLLTGCTATIAAKYNIGICLLFSHSNDHYIRAYIQIQYGAKKADKSINNLGYILHCFDCFHREIIKNPFTKSIEECPECSSKMSWAGPLWLGEIFNKRFCDLIIEENKRVAFRNNRKISKILTLTKGEIGGPETYFVIDKISDKLSLPVPSVSSIIQKLQDRGFSAVPTHFNPRGIRTNAPALIILNLLKNHCKT